MRVLVVDDSGFTRKLLVEVFQDLGVEEIEEAGDGNEALEMLGDRQYELVTVDLVMPSSNGLDVIKYVKRTAPDTKVVVCSSVNVRETIMEIVKLGIDEFILKPFTQEKLQSALKQKVEECKTSL